MPRHAAIPRSVFLVTVLAACGDRNGEHAIVECTYDDRALAWDEASPDGVVAEDVLAFSEGTHVADGRWEAGGSTEVTVDVTRRGEGPTHRENTAGGCGSYLAIPVTVALATADGRFDESRADVLATTEGQEATGWISLGTSLGGTFEPPVPAGDRLRDVVLEVRLAEGIFAGWVEVLTEGDDGDVAWAASERVLTWGEAD